MEEFERRKTKSINSLKDENNKFFEKYLDLEKEEESKYLQKTKKLNFDQTKKQPFETTILIQTSNLTNKKYEEMMKNLPHNIELLKKGKKTEKFFVLNFVQDLLCEENNNSIDYLLSFGILPNLIEILDEDEDPGLQYEAACCIANICTGTSGQAEMVIQAGCMPILIRLLLSTKQDLQYRAAVALCNILENSDEVSYEPWVDAMVKIFISTFRLGPPLGIKKAIVCCLSNLVERWNKESKTINKHFPDLALILLDLIAQQSHQGLLSEACYSLERILYNNDPLITLTMQHGLCNKIFEIFRNNSFDSLIQVHCLNILADISSGAEEHVYELINAGILPLVYKTLLKNEQVLHKQCCLILYNVCEVSDQYIQLIIDMNFVPILLELLEEEDSIKKNAFYALSSMVDMGGLEQMGFLINSGIIQIFVDFLNFGDNEVVLSCLGSLQKIFKLGEIFSSIRDINNNPIVLNFISCGGLDNIRKLKLNNDDKEINILLGEIMIHFLNEHNKLSEEEKNFKK
ncbi:importin subunit alpha-4 [Anaeramoeba flamelloides]|uniref:Importin subunit alpha-4 n=1 Tax=Anaeramoeba flamelloides TaxID=1746091 RepID=A0ABQ8YG59_9EUKA|nr:importin subunit alpha-4 [Anaeramoeba flamelloides]